MASGASVDDEWVADGAEVLDTRASLIWSRCVEGMRWNGRRCEGQPTLLTHSQALAAAAARREAEGKAWRLPRLQELRQLAQHQAKQPARAAQAFPDAVADWHWTSSTVVDTGKVNPYAYGNVQRGVSEANVNRIGYLHGWTVHMGSGDAQGETPKRTPLAVRLVR